MASAKALEDRLLGVPSGVARARGKGRGPAEDSPGFAWWKQGNREAGVGFAKKHPAPPTVSTGAPYRNKVGRKVVSAAQGESERHWGSNRTDSWTGGGDEVTVRPAGSRRTPGAPSVQNRGSERANRKAIVAKANRLDDRRR